MKCLRLILLFWLFFGTVLFADPKADSLSQIISGTEGVAQIKARIELSYHFRRSNPEKAKQLAQTALNDIQKLRDRSLEANALFTLGLSYFYSNDHTRSKELLLKSMELAEKENDLLLLSEIYYFIGASYYYENGDNEHTLEYYNRSIHYSLLTDNYRILGAVYSSLSNLFRVSGAYEKALEFIHRSKENYEKANYDEGLAWIHYMTGSLYNTVGLYEESIGAYNRSLDMYREMAEWNSVFTGVAICLDQLGVVNTSLGRLDLARQYNQEALELHVKGGSRYGISNSLKYLARIEHYSGNNTGALAYLDSSKVIKLEMRNHMGLSGLYELYGLIYMDQKKFQQAIESFEEGLEYALANDQLNNIIDINKNLANVYSLLGDYEKAFTYKSLQVSVTDSINTSKTTRNMLQLDALYNIEAKEKKINQLENENLIAELSLAKQHVLRNFLFGLIGLGLVIIFMFFYFYRAKVRSHHRLIESKRHVDEINATKDRFFSILAHDLRSPFNSILGLVNLLKQRSHSMDREQMDLLINAIHTSSHNSYALLNSLLEWSRTQRGTMKLIPETFILNDLLEDVDHLLLRNAEDKQITFEGPEETVTVSADKNMIHTVLRNLVSNAIKYSRSGDTVKVRVSKHPTHTRIAVIDTGIGMEKEDLHRLFRIEENYQVDGTAGEKGTGLGLIICKEFIEKHGGRIWAESEPGEGSSFYFTIPGKLKYD